MSLAIRSAFPEDAPAISALVVAAFHGGIAPHYGEQGRKTFLDFVTPEAISTRLEGTADGWVAGYGEREILGYLELDGDHMRMLFVRPDAQRRGVGRGLLKFLQVFRDGHRITLHSAPNADAFYLAMGFHATGPRQQQDGVVFTPMEIVF